MGITESDGVPDSPSRGRSGAALYRQVAGRVRPGVYRARFRRACYTDRPFLLRKIIRAVTRSVLAVRLIARSMLEGHMHLPWQSFPTRVFDRFPL